MTGTPMFMGLFCEDIRQEKGETITIVGVLPDNIIINPPSSGAEAGAAWTAGSKLFSKLTIYARMNFDAASPAKPVSIYLKLANGQRNKIAYFDDQIINKARFEAQEKNSPLAGVVSITQLVGFKAEVGVVIIEFEPDGHETVAVAALNFKAPALTAAYTVQ